MEVFTIKFSLNLMLPFVSLTHMTTHSSESIAFLSEFVAYKHSSLWLWDHTQNFRLLAAIDLVWSNLSPSVLVFESFFW